MVNRDKYSIGRAFPITLNLAATREVGAQSVRSRLFTEKYIPAPGANIGLRR